MTQKILRWKILINTITITITIRVTVEIQTAIIIIIITIMKINNGIKTGTKQ